MFTAIVGRNRVYRQTRENTNDKTLAGEGHAGDGLKPQLQPEIAKPAQPS